MIMKGNFEQKNPQTRKGQTNMRKTNMKKPILTAIVVLSFMLQNLPAAVTFTGTSINSGPSNLLNLTTGQLGVYIVKDQAATNWNTLFGTGKINFGLTVIDDATYDASLFTIMSSKSVSGTTTKVVSAPGSNIALANGISTGDEFAFLLFNTSTTTTIAGDTFSIYRASDWLIPADATSFGFSASPTAGASYQTLNATSYLIGTGTVAAIPEPSSASLLALGVAGLVALRARRKS